MQRFEERLKQIITRFSDLSPALQAAVTEGSMALSVALTTQRENIVNEFASAVLLLDQDASVVRLEQFIVAHKNCVRLLKMLSSDQSPYHDIEAILLSCTIARAINALCENIMRSFRLFQACSGVSRWRMANFGCVAGLALTVFGSIRSAERERHERANVSVSNRTAQADMAAQLAAIVEEGRCQVDDTGSNVAASSSSFSVARQGRSLGTDEWLFQLFFQLFISTTCTLFFTLQNN